MFNNRVLPFFVFPCITALAFKCIFIDALPQTLVGHLAASCASDSLLWHEVALTGSKVVDDQLCALVAFFNGGIADQTARRHFIELLTNMGPIPAFALLESVRAGRNSLLSGVVVTIIGLIYQRMTGGVVLPIYWLLFLVTGQANRVGHLDQAKAEATLFAFMVAYVVPTTAMFVMEDGKVTLIWQFFPLLMYLAQRFHLLVRPSRGAVPGRRTAQALYALTFIVSAVPHLAIVWPIQDNPRALIDEFVPRKVGATEKISLEDGARNFLQWDGVFILGSGLLATLWFARSLAELLILILWNISASFTIGPGAALSVVYAWREERVTPL